MPALIDNIAYVGSIPWHGLGNEIPEGTPVEDWPKYAGLDWEVLERPVYFEDDGILIPEGRNKVLVRSDNMYPLSVVSNSYQVVQPKMIVDFYSRLCNQYGFTMETMGSLKNGQRIWGLAKTDKSFKILGHDVVNQYVLLATSFDKTLATKVIPTSVRVVCNNTLSAAYMFDEVDNAGLTISHSTFFDVDKVFNKILAVDDVADKFETDISALAEATISETEALQYFMDMMYPNKTAKEVKESTRSRNILEEIIDIYHSAPGQNMISAKGTAWGAVNAITYYTDHVRGRSQDNRVSSAWFGPSNTLKTDAMEVALDRFAA